MMLVGQICLAIFLAILLGLHPAPHQPKATSLWGAGAFYFSGTFYLFYTVNESLPDSSAVTKSIGVATSKYPDRGFVDHGIQQPGDPNDWYYAAHPSYDPVSKHVYIYFSDHWKRLLVRQFDPKTNKLVGKAQVVLDSGQKIGKDDHPDSCPSQKNASERAAGHQQWEGCVLEHSEVFYAPQAPASHRYYLLYNGSGGATPRYAIGYAYASSATGPFHRAEESPQGETAHAPDGTNPLVYQHPNLTVTMPEHPICHNAKIGFYGPGAPNVFHDQSGQLWLMYRFKTSAEDTWSCRGIGLSRLDLNRTTGALSVTVQLGTISNGPQL